MRIAFSGSHRVGKSTLIEQVAEALPHYVCVDEPYHLLEEDGYESADPPAAEDYAAQLDRSIDEITGSDDDVLFDRCPADLLAYLIVGGYRVEAWFERASAAMNLLDLVVFVPIEEPDRIVVSSHEDLEQRRLVDETLYQLLFDDELGDDVLIVQGDVGARVTQVLARVATPAS